jgi:hypothetical protein
MTSNNKVDAARVELLLTELHLPGVKLMWDKLAEQSDKEGWPAARFLAALAEHESADRGRAASSAILPKRGSRPASRSPPSTSRPCQWSRKPR